jgi:hypothetical protein
LIGLLLVACGDEDEGDGDQRSDSHGMPRYDGSTGERQFVLSMRET